jgi:hypothetical protein
MYATDQPARMRLSASEVPMGLGPRDIQSALKSTASHERMHAVDGLIEAMGVRYGYVVPPLVCSRRCEICAPPP